MYSRTGKPSLQDKLHVQTLYISLTDSFTDADFFSGTIFLQRQAGICYGRRLFRTDAQRFGIGHEALRIEDEIWLLAGAQVPFILRRRPDGKFTLIGEAYVDGMMYGELWPAMKKDLVDVILE